MPTAWQERIVGTSINSRCVVRTLKLSYLISLVNEAPLVNYRAFLAGHVTFVIPNFQSVFSATLWATFLIHRHLEGGQFIGLYNRLW